MSRTSAKKRPAHWTSVVDAAHTRARSYRRKAATLAAGALAVFMGYHVIFGQNGLTAYEHKRQDARSLKIQTVDLERENERLRGHVDRLQNDPGAIEHQAREELHYTRAGEVIYTLPNDPIPPHIPSASKP